MTREQLEHIVRASADITGQYEFVIVGSQSILGAIPRPPAEFTASAEADIYPLNAPELADEIDGAIGEGSHFHDTFGYYAQGVGPETAYLPAGWQHRVHRVQGPGTNERVAYCLDVCDLFLSKAAAGRDKDREFCTALLVHKFLTASDALERTAAMPLDAAAQDKLRRAIRRWEGAAAQRREGETGPSAAPADSP